MFCCDFISNYLKTTPISIIWCLKWLFLFFITVHPVPSLLTVSKFLPVPWTSSYPSSTVSIKSKGRVTGNRRWTASWNNLFFSFFVYAESSPTSSPDRPQPEIKQLSSSVGEHAVTDATSKVWLVDQFDIGDTERQPLDDITKKDISR